MTDEKRELILAAARNLLAHRDAGRVCDPHSVAWAEQVLRSNPQPAISEKEAAGEKQKQRNREMTRIRSHAKRARAKEQKA